MNIGTLIELLEEISQDMPEGDDTEVTFTMQANWPLESTIRGVFDCREIEDEEESGHGTKVTLVEGSQIGYGSKSAFEDCNEGW